MRFQDEPNVMPRLHPDHVELLAMRRMWRAVLDQMLSDALGEGIDADRARVWFTNVRPAPTPTTAYGGFAEVCDLAGLEPSTVIKQVNEELQRHGKLHIQ